MSKRKAVEPPSVHCHGNNTINMYFTIQPGPASAPEAAAATPRATSLFPPSERTHTKMGKYNGSEVRKIVSMVTSSGKLVGDCYNCTKASMDIAKFAPRESNNNFHKRPDYLNALDAYHAAYEAGDYEEAKKQRAIVEEGRAHKCPSCVQKIGHMTPKKKACKEFYDTLRRDKAIEQDGCLYPDCTERGTEAWCVLEGDHIHGSNDPDPELRKVHALSDYPWWSCHGGVAAMRKEVAKGIEWKCRFCHMKDPLSNCANKCPDPATMPEGKRGKNATPEEIKQSKARWHATNVYPKHQFVDAHKREVRRACLRCARPVLEGEEHCFIFDHRDETTKMKGKDTLAGETGGVAGLVHNCSKSEASLEKIQSLLEREMDLCDLLCANCDRRKTFGYPERADVIAAREANEE